ncbi:precorrin-3B C(17)-methyltransferase [Bacillus sp. FJAT-47783]|uniref:precorrin-3B C(17)-methyltransferase n=1 Tax=Bacillus sp. FJAT-47783 TaxID=2922712 RepID=UPI001FAE465E|nr:precorrin-3B C(17)-methyltransferase [Bacillus sp. FJAT-47783]
MSGKLFVIGFGPGSEEHFTKRAKEAIQESDSIIGYKTYVDLVRDFIVGKEVVSTGMSEEVTRAIKAVKLAEQGRKVAVISSGDSGVYGMGGLVYEVLVERGWTEKDGIQVEIVPGISAINSCASLLGAPIMHDACTISLSDHLTPWSIIEKRIEAAAMADFVIALYNPKSGKRTKQIVEAQKILLKYRSKETPVGLVKSAYRERQHIVITTLEEMLEHEIGMLTTVIIGNSTTFLYDNKMITPRGYQRKYTLTKEEQPLKPHERLRKENEPWALHGGKDSDSIANLVELANEALSKIKQEEVEQVPFHHFQESILEFAVSPGLANKQFTPKQLKTLAEVVGENGTMEYTPHHQIYVKISTQTPEAVTRPLEETGLMLLPIGNVVKIKACDFCDGEKSDSIPYVEELHNRIGGMELPKTLRIGFNGCGMACYGAVHEDIGIVYRKGKFDLFIGAKPVGRTAHPGQLVAEGIPPEQLVDLVCSIVDEYKEKGHPNERFFKFFKRVKEVQGFVYRDIAPKMEIAPLPCGD